MKKKSSFALNYLVSRKFKPKSFLSFQHETEDQRKKSEKGWLDVSCIGV